MTKKKVLVYDATIVSNALSKNAARSGIFFVVYNIFKELLRRKDIELKLYCNPNYLAQLRHVLETRFKDWPAPEIINQSEENYFFAVKGVLIQKKHECRDKGNKFRKSLYHVLSQIMGLLSLLSPSSFFGREWIKKLENADVFLSPMNAAPAVLSKYAHIKKFTVLYDAIPLIFPEYFPKLKRKMPSYVKLIRSINGKDFYFAISENTKNDFIKYVPVINPEHITVIPLAPNMEYRRITDAGIINAARKKYGIPDGKRYMLSICTLEPRKNLIFAVRNFAAFIEKNNIDDIVFVLGGASWDSFAKKFGAALGSLKKYKDKIIQAGYIDDEDMNALYCGAEIFVYPSLYEGFGMPILEAMRCGTPVICSGASAMPEVIGDAGLTISPANDEELIKAFETLYFNGNLRNEYSKKGEERAKKFSWDKTVEVMAAEMLR
ncbi:MAG: glycosyltransferase family 4 protein [Elusimicrobia bacterium]|nr:glycosyltransferase family 4 protein [Elusimicrobiota bacterium]